MAYATVQDLLSGPFRRNLEEMTAPGTGAADGALLTRALEEASAEIDAYVGGRVTLPLAHPPLFFTALACEIAIYRLMAGLPRVSVKDITERYDKAIAFLRKVAAGDVPLVPPPADSAVVSAGEAEYAGPPRMFSAHSLRGL